MIALRRCTLDRHYRYSESRPARRESGPPRIGGGRGVFYIPPKFLPDEAEIGVRLVELAAIAGVERFGVFGRYVSVHHRHAQSSRQAAGELALVKSGMAFTIYANGILCSPPRHFFGKRSSLPANTLSPGTEQEKLLRRLP